MYAPCVQPFFNGVCLGVGSQNSLTVSIHFVEPCVNAHGRYYQEVLLMQKILPYICQFTQLSKFYVFQQDGAPANRVRESWSVDKGDFILHFLMLCRQIALNSVDYTVWSVIQEKVCKGQINDVDDCVRVWRTRSARYWHGSQAVAHASSCLCSNDRLTLWTQTEPVV